jgi:hypothetical protein
MSSRQQQQRKYPQATLNRQIVEAASKVDFANREKVVAAIFGSLVRAGCDREAIERALQNVSVSLSVDEPNLELEICLHF